MKNRIQSSVLAALFLSFSSTSWASLPSSAFKEADDAFRLRQDSNNARKAMILYRKIFVENPQNSEAAWRLAMANYFVGLRLTQDSNKKLRYFLEGRDAGIKSTELAPNCAPCHFWTAINMALYGETAGVFKMIFSLATVKNHLKTSMAADPTYAFGGAQRLLGLIEQKLPGILGGDDQRALKYFEQAIVTAPDEPLNYLFLARLLSKELKQPEKAKQVARTGLSVPAPASDRVESIEALNDLKTLITKLDQR